MDEEIEQVSLSQLIGILLKRKRLIAIVTAIFLIIGIVQTYVLTSTRYASEIVLEINNIETLPSKQPIDKEGAVYNILESITSAGDMDFESYLNEVTSEEVLVETIEDLDLEDKYTPESLKSSISIDSDSELKIINLRLLTEDPAQGQEIINTLAENFSDHITKRSQEIATQTQEIIKTQMEIEREKHAEALKEYEEATKGIKSSYELELELEATYEQLTQYKSNLNDLKIQKEAIQGALKTADSSGGGIIVRPSGSGEDTVYNFSNTSKQALEVELAETNSRIESTNKSIETMQDSIEKIKTDFQDIEFAEGVIRQKVELTKESYEAFAMKYQELKMQSSIDIGGISINIISDTIPSTRPVGTRKIIKLAVFLVLGIMTGVILSFLVEYLDIMKAKKTNK